MSVTSVKWSEFASMFLGETVAKKAVLLETLERHALNKKLPKGFNHESQKTDKFGYYETVWSDENPFPEPIINLANTSTSGVAEKTSTEIDSTVTSIDEHRQKEASVTSIPAGQLIPKKMVGFVSNSNFTLLKKLISANQHFPVYISGDTGCGKTLLVQQACAQTKRELVRVNFTEQTGEAHLIGSFKLVDGETVWVDGPAITAMRRGAVLLLDEVDLGSPRIMCLQPILEGSPYFIERTGELVTPAPGFTIVATANTKGKMSGENRKFVGARVQNEAFLDRFCVTIEHEYPTEKQELRILMNSARSAATACGMQFEEKDEKIINALFAWVRAIREAYLNGSYDSHLSTRRARDMVRAYFILDRNIKKSVVGVVNRFDEHTKEAFLKMFNAMNDEDVDWSDVFDIDKNELDEALTKNFSK